MNKIDEKFMRRALKLAVLGGRAVAPNPLVGAVIVKNGRVIGEGYHKKFGGPHAEVNAIRSVKRKGDLIGATIYVTLEPCRHWGKTPPCRNAIVRAGIARIVCGSCDPFQKSGQRSAVSGQLEFLKGPLAQKCQQLNKFYFTWITKRRPYVTIKVAVSADGFMAGKDGQPVHFTSRAQDRRVHELRAQHQAIMVGSNTVLSDDPHLGVRLVKGADPLRIVLDPHKRVPKKAQVFRDKNVLHIKKHINLGVFLRQLGRKGIASVLVEPGPTLYASLKKQELVDELVVLRGARRLKQGLRLLPFPQKPQPRKIK